MLNNNLLITISEEYKNLVPRSSLAQLESLKESMEKYGQLETIKVNETGIILDGHQRLIFCEKLNLVPKYEVKTFKTKELERMFVIATNLRRRQLTIYQQIILLEKEREIFKKVANESRKKLLSNQKLGITKPLSKEKLRENRTDFKIAEIVGTSTSTVTRVNYIKKFATPEELVKIEFGDIGIDTMFRKIVKRLRGDGVFSKYSGIIDKPCPSCNAKLRKRKMCHVHKKLCCTNCEWGE